MGCSKCNKTKCGCDQGGSDIGNLQAILADIQETLNGVIEDTKFLSCGHPIIMIQNKDDINSFDLSTGLGSECWEGWAVCNGESYKNPVTKKTITTPNLLDKFVVGAAGTYAVGDTGGANSVALTTPEMPAHNHAVVDPGHTHTITDTGHDHAITDPGHVHVFTGTPHSHDFTTSTDGGHEHQPGSGISIDDIGTEVNVRREDQGGASTSTNGSHNHNGTTDVSTADGTVVEAFTGVDVSNAFTGITNEVAPTGITTQNTGTGTAHENRPPYYALIFVMKI